MAEEESVDAIRACYEGLGLSRRRRVSGLKSPASRPNIGARFGVCPGPCWPVYTEAGAGGGGEYWRVLYARSCPARRDPPHPGPPPAAHWIWRLSVKLHCSSNEVVRVKLQSYIFSLHFILIEKRHT